MVDTPATETPAATPAVEKSAVDILVDINKGDTPEEVVEAKDTETEVLKVEQPEEKPDSLRVLAKKEAKARKALAEAETLQKTVQEKEQLIAKREQALKSTDEVHYDPVGYIAKLTGKELTKDEMLDIACLFYESAGVGNEDIKTAAKEIRQKNKFKKYDSLPSEEEILKKAQDQLKQEQVKQQYVQYQNSLCGTINGKLDKLPHIDAYAKANPDEATAELMQFVDNLAAEKGDVFNLDSVAEQFENYLKSKISIFSHIYTPKVETAKDPAPDAAPAKEPQAPKTLNNSNSIQTSRGKQDPTREELDKEAAAYLREINAARRG